MPRVKKTEGAGGSEESATISTAPESKKGRAAVKPKVADSEDDLPTVSKSAPSKVGRGKKEAIPVENTEGPTKPKRGKLAMSEKASEVETLVEKDDVSTAGPSNLKRSKVQKQSKKPIKKADDSKEAEGSDLESDEPITTSKRGKQVKSSKKTEGASDSNEAEVSEDESNEATKAKRGKQAKALKKAAAPSTGKGSKLKRGKATSESEVASTLDLIDEDVDNQPMLHSDPTEVHSNSDEGDAVEAKTSPSDEDDVKLQKPGKKGRIVKEPKLPSRSAPKRAVKTYASMQEKDDFPEAEPVKVLSVAGNLTDENKEPTEKKPTRKKQLMDKKVPAESAAVKKGRGQKKTVNSKESKDEVPPPEAESGSVSPLKVAVEHCNS